MIVSEKHHNEIVPLNFYRRKILIRFSQMEPRLHFPNSSPNVQNLCNQLQQTYLQLNFYNPTHMGRIEIPRNLKFFVNPVLELIKLIIK
jgi:hypothetical protein